MPGWPVWTSFCRKKKGALSLSWSHLHFRQVQLPRWTLSSTLASSMGSDFFRNSETLLFAKMSTPSRSRSSSRGDEGYFEWRENMERRQWESERQVQALLQETRRLREENDVLRIQVSSEPPRCQQRRSLRCNQEAMYPGNASPPLDAHGVWPGEGPVPTHCAPQEESLDFTRIS